MSDTALSRAPVPPSKRSLPLARRRVRLTPRENVAALRVVYAALAAYAALFAFAAVTHFMVLETPRLDLGDMVQAIWNTQHGHVLESTTLNGRPESRLGTHVDPFLLVFVPLFWVWSSPVLLLVVQAVAVASGALPVFWLARKHLGSARSGAHFALAYLLYPATQFNAFTVGSSFHPVSLAVPLVLFAIWFLDEDRLLAFSAAALLACTTKEEIPLAVGCLGIWYAVRRGHRSFGSAVFGIGLAITLFNFLWVIPHFSPSGRNPFAGRYVAVGSTTKGMVHKAFTDPMAFVNAVATGHKTAYLAILLLPFLCLCFLEPLLLLGAVPDLAINLLSSKGEQSTLLFQYTAGIVPFVVAASIFGAARLKKRGLDPSLWALLAVAAVALYSPIDTLGKDVSALGSPLLAAKAHAVRMIPQDAPVSVSNRLGSSLSDRRYVSMFPSVGKARWVVVDSGDPLHGRRLAFRRELLAYQHNPVWRTVFFSHGIVVLHRVDGTR